MNRMTSRFALATFLALGGCASAGTTVVGGPSAVQELARLQSIGELDPSRLVCVTEALAVMSASLPERVAWAREYEAAVQARAMSSHASSVQQGMYAGDAMAEAGRQAVNAFKQAAALEASGNERAALLATGYAMDLEQQARAMDVIAVAGPRRNGAWSEEEAALFVEYSSLMVERIRSAAPRTDVEDRIHEIESTHPDVVEGYAESLLDLHQDPDLPCVPKDR